MADERLIVALDVHSVDEVQNPKHAAENILKEMGSVKS